MSREMRKRARVSYYEPEEPNFDEYVYCTSCGDYVYEYCSIHGPLPVIPDDEIFDKDHKPSHVLDARDPNKSNWMRYVNCSRHYSEQNLVAFQYQGQLYYRTIRIVPRFTELLVFYGSEFASELHVDLRRYQSPVYTETLVKCSYEESLDDTMQPTDPTFNINDFQNLKTDNFTPKLNGSQYQLSETTSIINLDSEEENETGEEKSFERSIPTVDLKNENIDPNYVAQDTYKCDNCNQSFNEKNLHVAHYLTTHIVNDDNRKNKNVCLICNIRFALKSDHINHDIKMHNSNIKYKECTLCDYKTVHSRDLKVHIETHSNVKIKCDLCEYETASKYNFKQHTRKHTKKENHECLICGNIYRTKSHFNRHIRIHSQEKRHICIICNKQFREWNGLSRHMKTHSFQELYMLKHC